MKEKATVGVGNCDCWRWEFRSVGNLKKGCRRKELSMGLENLMKGTCMYSD
jgi:hypothetical protein